MYCSSRLCTHLHVVSKSSTLVGNASELFCMTSCIITRHFSKVCIEHLRISCLFVRARFQRNRIARFVRTCWLAKLDFCLPFSCVTTLGCWPSVVRDCWTPSKSSSNELLNGAHQNIAASVPAQNKQETDHNSKLNILLGTLRCPFNSIACAFFLYLLLFKSCILND